MANKVQVIFEIDKDAQGRTTLNQIESGITRLGRSSTLSGRQIDASLSFLRSAVLLEFFRQGAQAAFEFARSSVQAFNEAQAAAKGLESVAIFKGIKGTDAIDAVNQLQIVKDGLISVSDASTALKNLLQTGFSLPEAIRLMKVFGDSAAFNRQASLGFGQAIVRSSEGVRLGMSTLADGVGVAQNLGQMLKVAGIEASELSNLTQNAGARMAIFNGFVRESAASVGDAAKFTNTFAGAQAQLEAQQQKLLVSVGSIITSNPELQSGFKSVGDTLGYLTSQLNDSESALNKFVDNAAAKFGALIEIASKLARGLNAIAAVINLFDPLGNILNPDVGVTGDDRKFQAEAKKRNDEIIKAYKDAQAKLKADLAAAPIISGKALEDKAKEDKKAFAEMKRDSDDYFRRQAADEKLIADLRKKSADNIREVGNTIAELHAKLAINPLALMYDSAQASQAAFLEKFKSVPQEMKAAFEKANREVLALELFKGIIGQSGNLNRLITDRAALTEGGGVFQEAALREARENGLRQAQELLAIATNAQQKQLALENILSLTSDVGSLSPTERDSRRNALDQSIAIQSQVLQENFDRLEKQTTAQNDNTSTMERLISSLGTVEAGLVQFRDGALLIKIENESVASVDLGRSFQ